MWVGLWVEIVEIFGTEFKNISIKFVNIGWPQVMRDHAARLHQTQLL